jgi:hypothetical protein
VVDRKSPSINLQLEGGGLPGIFQFTNFHLHWLVSSYKLRKLSYIHCLFFFRGASPSEGSEHTVNGSYGAGEAHFVFTNVKTEQLAVLAFFIVPSANEQQRAWGAYVDNAVTLIDEGTQKQFLVNLMQLMETENSFEDFWRYDGSLTTPPCSESVICEENLNYFLNYVYLYLKGRYLIVILNFHTMTYIYYHRMFYKKIFVQLNCPTIELFTIRHLVELLTDSGFVSVQNEKIYLFL